MTGRYAFRMAPKDNASNGFAMLALLLLWGAVSPPGVSQNMGFLHQTPIASFQESDFKLVEETGRTALNSAPRGKTLSWQNPATGNSGDVTVLGRFTAADQRSCARVVIVNRARGISGEARYTMCKSADGLWKFDPEARPPKKTN